MFGNATKPDRNGEHFHSRELSSLPDFSHFLLVILLAHATTYHPIKSSLKLQRLVYKWRRSDSPRKKAFQVAWYAMANAHSLELDDIAVILNTLQSCIVNGYGPSFQHTLVSTSTGKVSVTNSGIQILKSLSLEHPIAHFITSCVESHSKSVGDDSKTFVLLLHDLIRNCHKVVTDDQRAFHTSDDQCRLSQDFDFAICEVLPHLLKAMERYIESIDLTVHDSKTSGIDRIVKSALGTHLLDYDVTFISQLLVTWLESWHCEKRYGNLPECITMLVDHQTSLVIESPGRAMRCSSIISGLLVSRSFSNSDQRSVSAGDGTMTKILLISCPIETAIDDTVQHEIEMQVSTSSHQETVSKIIGYKRLRTDAFLRTMTEMGIKIIFSSSLMSTLEKTLCSRYGITVIHTVPENELRLVAATLGGSILDSTLDFDPSFINEIESCVQTQFGGQNYVHIKFGNASSAKPSTLIVASPTEGLCRQARMLIVDSLKVIRGASVNSSRSLLEPPRHGSVCSMDVPNEERFTYISVRKSSRASEAGDSGVGMSPSNTMKERLSDNDDSRSQLSLSPVSIACSTDSLSHLHEDESKHLQCMPAGGAFEIALHEVISNYLSTQPAHAPGSTALTILKESLLTVPRLLHTNAFFIAKPRWISTVEAMRASTKHGPILGVDATEGSAVRVSQLQPFYSKRLLIINVLATLRQLLKIDGIIKRGEVW